MKDLEKIKSEDLAAQVQDANPANFAIEQEVAQLVGATVPQPTEPSADDARELGAQLLVFLRRALTPIQTALRTAVAAIYAHLDSRCTDYTPAAYASFQDPSTVPPYDPMRPFVPRTLPNLLTALTAFAPRKISGVPEAADGESILQVLNRRAEITEIVDDNYGWTMTINPLTYFANVEKLQMGCSAMVYTGGLNAVYMSSSHLKELDCPNLETITDNGQFPTYNSQFGSSVFERVSLPKLKSTTGCLFQGGVLPPEVELPALETATRGVLQGVSGIKRLLCPELKSCNGYSYNPNVLANCPDLEYAYIPNLTSMTWYGTTGAGGTLKNMPKLAELHIGKVAFVSNSYNTEFLENCGSLIKLVIYGDLNQNLYLNSWNPTDKGTTFLQNFREHIALRLTANGTGKTLTLSQAVRNAIHAAESTYGIENIIVTQKGWTLSPAPTA